MPDIEKKYLDYAGLSEYHDLLSDSIDTKISNINTFTGATSSTAGAKGLVPSPAAGDQDKFLKGDGTWAVSTESKYFVTPQDYGAVGDGVTDDTEAIIAAEAAANTSSKVLFFPAGTYKVRANQIHCHAGMTWFGDKNKSIIILDSTTSENGDMISGGYSGTSNSGSNITIHDLIFRGTETFGTSANGVKLFALWNGNNCSFYNCVFQNNKNLALCLISSNKINIHNCRFEATDCGIEAMGNDAVYDVTIRDCYFSGISSYNGWKNVSSEPISSYCGKNNTSPNERWIIENCVFEHKSTNAILFSASGSPSMSDGVINNKDVVIRSCTFRGVAGCIKIEKSENVLVDDIFLDDTTKDVAATANINSIVRIEGSKNITVKNVTSKCQQISFNALGTDAYCDNILFENIDSYAPNRTASEPFAIFKGNNIIVKNTLVHPIATSNKVIYINFDQLTNSSIDIDCTKEEGGIVVYFINSGNTTVHGNDFIINTDVDIRRNIPYSTSVADANNWILKGNGSLTWTALTSINRQQPKRSYVINVNNSSQFDALDDTTDFALMQNDYEFYLDFVSSVYSAGKSFSLNNTGNIIPINQPITFSNDYKVVCHFVQKNAKWVEVERTLEYYEGTDTDVLTLTKVTTLPTASAVELGNTYMYMGANDTITQLIHGGIYECVSDGEATPTYSWQRTDAQSGGDALQYTIDGDNNTYSTIQNATEDGIVEIQGRSTSFTKNVASGVLSHAEGMMTSAIGEVSHAEGYMTSATGLFSHVEGMDTKTSGMSSHAEGIQTIANEICAHAEGSVTIAIGDSSHAEGQFTTANGQAAHAEGTHTEAIGNSSHAEGYGTCAVEEFSHAEGGTNVVGETPTIAIGESSHAEGISTTAGEEATHAEGKKTLAAGSCSHVEGNSTTAYGFASHTEGNQTSAIGNYSHAEGYQTCAEEGSHAEGYQTCAIGVDSHAEGYNTIASGDGSHSQNDNTIAQGENQTAIGKYNTAEGSPTSAADTDYAFIIGNGTATTARSNAFAVQWNGQVTQDNGATSFKFGKDATNHKGYTDEAGNFNRLHLQYTIDGADGTYAVIQNGIKPIPFVDPTTGTPTTIPANVASGRGAIASGAGTVASGAFSHAEGIITSAIYISAHAEGMQTYAGGEVSHAEGGGTLALGAGSHAEGELTTASGIMSHTEGYGTLANNNHAHAEGMHSSAVNKTSHAEGFKTSAAGDCSHAEGGSSSSYQAIGVTEAGTFAVGQSSHSEGFLTSAVGELSHAEGVFTCAVGLASHTEGAGMQGVPVTAIGECAHAEGQYTRAIGNGSHSENVNTEASGIASHAEGSSSLASGDCSHAEGSNTIAGYTNQHVQGQYNDNKSTTLFEVGNGTNTSRSNAFEVYSNGFLSTNNGTTKSKLPTLKTATLAAGSTTVTFTDMPTTGDNLIDFYTSVLGLNYTAISQSGTSITLTYPAQSSAVTCYCSITEIN